MARLKKSDLKEGESYNKKRKTALVEKMNTLADHLAEGLTVDEAAAAMGEKIWTARPWFKRIRQSLGWQAR